MRIRIQTMGFMVMTMLGASVLGCAPTKVDAAPPPPAQAERTTARTREGKITAPVELSFASAQSATSPGAVVLTLTVRALTDIPSGVARVILPPKLKLLSGQSEIPFGSLPKDAERQFSLTVDASATGGPLQIFAGVDCHITSGIQLHKEAQPLLVGQSPNVPN